MTLVPPLQPPRPLQPLHLRRADPLPDLPLNGAFDLESYAGAWLLLVFAVHRCDGDEQAVQARCDAFGRRIAVRWIDAVAEPEAARRVGALVAEDAWFDLAILLDPRGRVQVSATAPSAVESAASAFSLV